jgi:hypothetical protein
MLKIMLARGPDADGKEKPTWPTAKARPVANDAAASTGRQARRAQKACGLCPATQYNHQ